jgi:hypothetical protein
MTAPIGNVSEIDHAYLAGIIDGEGTVSITRSKTRKNGRDLVAYQPELTVSNTNLILLGSLHGRFGGHLVKANIPAHKNWRQGYILFFRRKEMLMLLPKVIPHLTAKRQKAELLFEYMSTRTKHVTAGMDGRFVGIPLTDRQKQIIAEIRQNNKRGPPI